MSSSVTGIQGQVDPEISRAKFAREIERYGVLEEQHRSRGCWLVKAEFPEAFVVFATDKTQPMSVVFGVRFDFSNYDMVPPSVRLANPFTWEPLKTREVPTPPSPFLRRKEVPVPPEMAAADPNIQYAYVEQPLLQSYGPEELPFLCIQGIREYHEHPLHSDDPWLPGRLSGHGTLIHLVEQIWKYGVQPLNGLRMNFQMGFQRGEVSE